MPSPSHLKTDKNSPEPKQGEIQFPEARSARDKQSKPDKTILIIGGGFAGLNVAKGLVGTNAKVLMIDRTNHHLFQPLLYQVATATLSPRDVAAPLRSILQKNPNLQVIMGSVCEFNPINKKVRLSDDTEFTYDYLVIAIGSRHSYFGHPEWEKIAPGLKTIQDAVRIREKILTSLEAAERISDKIEQRKCLTYVIIGGFQRCQNFFSDSYCVLDCFKT
ncbi:hypothetical protein EBR96_09885, partial [bacterium]|nr:hypothetical protein [bacterium]